MAKDKSEKNPGKTAFEALLRKINLEEYREFMRHYAAKNQNFQTEVEVYFADKDDRIDVSQKYADLVRKLIRKYSDQGYVDYRATDGLSEEVDQLLQTGYDLAGKGNYLDAFLVAKPVLHAMAEVLPNSDDSAGNLSGTIDNIVQLIATVAEAPEAAPALKEQIFAFLQGELTSKVHFEYGDYGYDLFKVYRDLAIHLGHTREFVRFVDAQVPKMGTPFESYRGAFYRKQKIEFFKALGNTEEVEKLIRQSLDIVEVRQGEVNKAIDRKDFAWAKQLIAEGIRLAEQKGHPGTVAQWQKELLRIAVLENDVDTIRYYAKLFAFDRGFDREYFAQWKKTYSPVEWKEIIEKHLQETTAAITLAHEKKKGSPWYSPNLRLLPALAPIYITEKYWDRLLALVQQENQLENILRFHKYLVKLYPSELLEIYLPAFERHGDQVNNRKEYADLARAMKKVMEDIPAGKEKIQAVARGLKAKYARRPAYVEELNAVLRVA
jgi:hypothetical protein